jgi:hypothetical protein
MKFFSFVLKKAKKKTQKKKKKKKKLVLEVLYIDKEPKP